MFNCAAKRYKLIFAGFQHRFNYVFGLGSNSRRGKGMITYREDLDFFCHVKFLKNLAILDSELCPVNHKNKVCSISIDS